MAVPVGLVNVQSDVGVGEQDAALQRCRQGQCRLVRHALLDDLAQFVQARALDGRVHASVVFGHRQVDQVGQERPVSLSRGQGGIARLVGTQVGLVEHQRVGVVAQQVAQPDVRFEVQDLLIGPVGWKALLYWQDSRGAVVVVVLIHPFCRGGHVVVQVGGVTRHDQQLRCAAVDIPSEGRNRRTGRQPGRGEYSLRAEGHVALRRVHDDVAQAVGFGGLVEIDVFQARNLGVDETVLEIIDAFGQTQQASHAMVFIELGQDRCPRCRAVHVGMGVGVVDPAEIFADDALHDGNRQRIVGEVLIAFGSGFAAQAGTVEGHFQADGRLIRVAAQTVLPGDQPVPVVCSDPVFSRAGGICVNVPDFIRDQHVVGLGDQVGRAFAHVDAFGQPVDHARAEQPDVVQVGVGRQVQAQGLPTVGIREDRRDDETAAFQQHLQAFARIQCGWCGLNPERLDEIHRLGQVEVVKHLFTRVRQGGLHGGFGDRNTSAGVLTKTERVVGVLVHHHLPHAEIDLVLRQLCPLGFTQSRYRRIAPRQCVGFQQEALVLAVATAIRKASQGGCRCGRVCARDQDIEGNAQLFQQGLGGVDQVGVALCREQQDAHVHRLSGFGDHGRCGQACIASAGGWRTITAAAGGQQNGQSEGHQEPCPGGAQRGPGHAASATELWGRSKGRHGQSCEIREAVAASVGSAYFGMMTCLGGITGS